MLLLYLILSATLIPDELYIHPDEVFHRITMDTTVKVVGNPLYWDPIDGARYYFTSDSFYLAILDNGILEVKEDSTLIISYYSVKGQAARDSA